MTITYDRVDMDISYKKLENLHLQRRLVFINDNDVVSYPDYITQDIIVTNDGYHVPLCMAVQSLFKIKRKDVGMVSKQQAKKDVKNMYKERIKL